MMIAASIIAPMAIAIPPRLMMFEPRPMYFIARNDRRIESGSVRMATSALRMCQRNTTHTSETMIASSISFSVRLSMERSIRSERSYVVTNSTPLGSAGWTFSLTAFLMSWMTPYVSTP